MIEILDTIPNVDVAPGELKRLLGYPRDWVVSGRARELADWVRAWYARHGRPWVYAREVESLQVDGNSLRIDNASFNSKRLCSTLKRAEAHGAILVAVGAGPEIEAEAQRAWADEKPDEYFFLEVFGSAVVEHLATMTGARLCAWAESRGMAVLPHYSPGYPEWDIAEQPRLLELVNRSEAHRAPAKIEVLESGMLRPKKSLLAVFGLTRHVERVRKLTDLIPCETCSYGTCQYRRAAYVRAGELSQRELPSAVGSAALDISSPVVVLDRQARYKVNGKALQRWADSRLNLSFHEDGAVDALFRYEGTTCSNMGRALFYNYEVILGPREDGYPIRHLRCSPAPGDEGHKYMCRYMSNADHLMVAIENDKPLLGRPLNDAMTWERPTDGAGCYCEPKSRKHKWGLVFETIHFALVQHEESRQGG